MKGIQAAMLSGSAMILLVLALRLALKKHLPRRLFPALWCAAAVRLLLPLEIPTRWSVWNLLHSTSTAQTVTASTAIPFPALARAAETGAVQTAKAGSIHPVLLVWAIGMALLAAYFIIGYAVMVRRFRGTRLAPQPSVDALLDRFRFSRDPRICRTANRRAPLCSGFARSRAEERICAILKYRRTPAWIGVCAAVLFTLSASVFATQAAAPIRTSQPPTVEGNTTQTAQPTAEPDVRYIEAEIVPLAAAAEAPKYVWPLEDADAEVTDPYGMRVHPLTKTEKFHSGVDLAAEGGENVLAVADGTVLDCSYNEAYGYILTLGHEDGVQTLYAHLRGFLVSPGDTVAQGQAIALAGATGWATGPHLHLGVVIDGEYVDPLAALGGE